MQMANLARSAASDPKFAQFAFQFSSIDDVDQWIRSKFVYRDEVQEIVRTPQFMLADMGRNDNGRTVGLEGDCDDVATFSAAVVTALGFPARLVAIRTTAHDPNFEHVFAEAFDGQHWKVLDATEPAGTALDSLEEMVVDV